MVLSETGSSNTAIGHDSLYSITTGTANVAAGREALEKITTGYQNTGIGYQAGEAITTGENNTCIGRTAGQDVTTGGNNLCLGNHAGKSASPSGSITTTSNLIVLGDNSPTAAYIKIDWTVTSDRRDKTDITPFSHGLSWINKLNPVTYRWDNRSDYADGIPDGSKKGAQLNVGLIAQDELEVEKEHGYGDTPENMLVADINADGNYGMQYSKLVPILINAVKELSAKNITLESRIAVLEAS